MKPEQLSELIYQMLETERGASRCIKPPWSASSTRI
jgi:hypothetical protein